MTFLLGAETLDLNQVDHLQGSFQRDALAATAAIFCLAFFVLLWMFLRSLSKHAVKIAELNEEHQTALAEINEKHAGVISQLHVADRERAVKLEITLHGLLEMVEDFRVISYDARKRLSKPAPPRRKTGEFTPPEEIPASSPTPSDDFMEGTVHIDPRATNPLVAGKKKGG